MKLSKEIKVGIVVLTGLAVLIYGFNFLKGKDIFKSRQQYYAIYDDIGGLTESNPVQINGFTVGRVNDIALHPKHLDLVVVGFVISEKSLELPKNTVARIRSLGLIGTMSITLEMGDSPVVAAPYDTLYSAVEEDIKTAVDKRIQPLEQKTKDLIASIDSVIQTVQAILDKDARDNLTESFEGIKRATRSFELTAKRLDTLVTDEKEKLGRIFSNVESITENLQKSNTDITRTLSNLANVSDSLAAANLTSTINNANRALDNLADVMGKINRGEGTMGMLVNNDTLYHNLEQTAGEMDKLVEDMRVNPDRYLHFSIFGRKNRSNKKE